MLLKKTNKILYWKQQWDVDLQGEHVQPVSWLLSCKLERGGGILDI